MTDEEFYIRPEDRERSYPFNNEGMMREAREFFCAYIWIRKSKDQPNARVGWCSNCEAFLDEDDMRAALKKAKTGVWHNADVDCPYCGRNVTIKEESRMRSYDSVFEDHEIAYIYRAQPDLVYIHVFDTKADHRCTDYPAPDFAPVYETEIARYRLRPGEFVSEHSGFVKRGGKYAWGFKQTKKPFDLPLGKLCGIVGTDSLADTFLRYHRLDDFYIECGTEERGYGYYYREIPAYRPLRYLCYFALYPQMEMAAKFGLHWAVNDLVNVHRKNARDLNWRAHTPEKFLRLDKHTAKEFLAESGSREVLQLLHRLKCAFAVKECKMLCAMCGARAEEAGQLLLKYGAHPDKLRVYTEKNKITASDWLDYAAGAEALGYDLTVHNVLFPKAFRAAHDDAARGLAVAEFKKLSKAKQAALKKRAKRYEWRCGGCIFVFPLSVSEIVEEGKALGHCVGGYAGRHIDGKTTIIFLRRRDSPEKSWYTIEIDGTRVRQAYGEKNKIKPLEDPEAARAFTLWQKHLTGGRRARFAGDMDGLKARLLRRAADKERARAAAV